MNAFITALMMWSLLVQLDVGLALPMKKVEETHEERVFHAICMPTYIEGSAMDFCGERAVLCSEQDKYAVNFSPEMVEWITSIKNLVASVSHDKRSATLPIQSEEAKKLFDKAMRVREILLRMGVAVISQSYQETVNDMQRLDALCKARKDEKKALFMQQQKNNIIKQHGLYKRTMKKKFKTGSVI